MKKSEIRRFFDKNGIDFQSGQIFKCSKFLRENMQNLKHDRNDTDRAKIHADKYKKKVNVWKMKQNVLQGITGPKKETTQTPTMLVNLFGAQWTVALASYYHMCTIR